MRYYLYPIVGVMFLVGSGCASTIGPRMNPANSPSSATQTVTSIPQNLCTLQPIEDESGALVFPIDPKYDQLPHLGQIFTAFDCKRMDIENIQRFEDGKYTAGILLTWKNVMPSKNTQTDLRTLGFLEVSTSRWKIELPLSLEDVERLKTIIDQAILAGDTVIEDCVKCG